MYKLLQKIQVVDILLIVGIALVSVGIGINLKKEENVAKIEIKKAITPTLAKGDETIMVDVEGAVVKPGVIKIKGGKRIYDALVECGGLALKADREWVDKELNKAELLRDGEKIYIPVVGEKPIAVLGVKAENSLIDINKAGASELGKLPGIGEAMAQRIIDYRNKNNGFKSIEELKLVEGIGEKSFEKIKDKVRL